MVKSTATNGKRKGTAPPAAATTAFVRKRVSSLKPSPENLALYKPTDEDDPDILRLAESIVRDGLRGAAHCVP